MSENILMEKSRVQTSMLATLKGYWTQAENYQKFAYIIGAVLIASGLFHLGVYLVDGGRWQGPVSWRKAISFGLSFGITVVTLAWLLNFFPKRPRLNGTLMAVLSIVMFGEVFLVTLQRWRGTASHFNFATPFDSVVFSMMGWFIALVGIAIVAMTFMSFFSLKASPSMAWAIRVGLIILLLGQASGGLIIQNGIRKVFDPATQEFVAAAMGGASTFGAAGKMKLLHSVTLHAIQVLPLLAWLQMFTNLSENLQAKMIKLAIIGYAGLIAVVAFQTLNGLALFSLSTTGLFIFIISALLILFAFGRALISLDFKK